CVVVVQPRQESCIELPAQNSRDIQYSYRCGCLFRGYQADGSRLQRISPWPASRFKTRAKTKQRSDSRFKYCMTGLLMASLLLTATTERSDRRQTVRAKWANAAARLPPGRMNSFK